MYWPMDQMGWKECYQKLSFFAVKIEFSKGPLAGDVRILRPTQDKITIGRSRRNFFCLLLDDAVSRKHACIRFHNHCFWIQDLGSSNGTWIRHQCAPSHVDVRLHYGDVVEIGTSRFSVSLCTWPNTSAIYSRHISYFDGYLGKLMHVPAKQLGHVVLPCKLVLRCGYVIFCDTLVRYTGSACASSRCPYSRNHLLAVLGFSFRRFSCSASCGAACSPQLKRSSPRLQVCSCIRGRIAVGLNASL